MTEQESGSGSELATVQVVDGEIVGRQVATAVLAELPDDEHKAQLASVSEAIRQLGSEIRERFLQIGKVLFVGVYGGDRAKIGHHGNRGDSIRAVALMCSGHGHLDSVSETTLRRQLEAYLGSQALRVGVADVERLGVTKLAAVHRATDDAQRTEIARALATGDVKLAKKTIGEAVKSHKAAVAAANASPPLVADSSVGPSNDARDEAAEQLAAQERREAAQKAAKLLLNQAFAAASAAGLTRVLVDKLLRDAFGDDE